MSDESTNTVARAGEKGKCPTRPNCPPGSAHPGRNNSPGVCAACQGEPAPVMVDRMLRPGSDYPRQSMAQLIAGANAKRAGCPSCRQKHAAEVAAREAARETTA